MHHIIYFNEKPLVLSEEKNALAEALLQQPGALFQNELSETAVLKMLKGIQEKEATGAVFLYKPVAAVLQHFKQQIRVIKAGGGLVLNGAGSILLIFRRGKWDLPKGKVDEGETAAAAALREVEEETGLKNLHLEKPLTTTYHTYYQDGELILKESHWFLMKSKSPQALVPQTDEDIEKCVWVQPSELPVYIRNTHPSIVDVLEAGFKHQKTEPGFNSSLFPDRS